MSNYARKAVLKNATGIDISKLAAKSALASLKAQIDKINVDCSWWFSEQFKK